MSAKEHWERVYSTKAPQAVSWYQPHAQRSLRWIRRSGLPKSGDIIDVGGGASTLVDDLVRDGYQSITVLDLSAAALAASRSRLGKSGSSVRWIEGDITDADLPSGSFDLWHDRAVFHFLTDERHQAAYVQTLHRSLKPGGHLIIATFAEDGPPKCSGLPVVRYSPSSLHAVIGTGFALVEVEKEEHRTPSGVIQHFVYCHFRRTDSGGS